MEQHAQKPTKQEPSHEELIAWLNDPHVDTFFDAVKKEVLFQRKAWGHLDATKSAAHWFWLIAKLASKALEQPHKRKHHIITTAACLFLWLEVER